MANFVKIAAFLILANALTLPLLATEESQTGTRSEEKEYFHPSHHWPYDKSNFSAVNGAFETPARPRTFSSDLEDNATSSAPDKKVKSLLQISPQVSPSKNFNILNFSLRCSSLAHQIATLIENETELQVEEELDEADFSNFKLQCKAIIAEIKELELDLVEALHKGVSLPMPPLFSQLLLGDSDSERGKRKAARRSKKPLTQKGIANGEIELLLNAMTSLTLAQTNTDSVAARCAELTVALNILTSFSQMQNSLFKVRSNQTLVDCSDTSHARRNSPICVSRRISIATATGELTQDDGADNL